MVKDERRNLRAFRRATDRLRAQAERNSDPCWLCHQPIDFSLPYHDKMAFTADHVTPIAVGGHILGTLKPAHRSCNSRRNDGTHIARTPTTREW